jgi:hypothetical protein
VLNGRIHRNKDTQSLLDAFKKVTKAGDNQ